MTHTQFINSLNSLKGNETELRNFVWNLAGDANKVLRQSMMEVLTGDRIPLAKCGINALYAECLTYINAIPVVSEESEADQLQPEAELVEPQDVVDNGGSLKDAKFEVGLKVVRRKCQRAGEVIAIEGLTVTVLLEDGSKRRPCMSRFRKLYIAA